MSEASALVASPSSETSLPVVSAVSERRRATVVAVVLAVEPYVFNQYLRLMR